MPIKTCAARLLARTGFAATLAFGAVAPASAQTYPQQPVKIVVSAAAGGPIDVFARIVAERMGQVVGQNFVVENVPGAGGSIGGQRVARAAPDGYTLLLGTSATHTFTQLLYKKPLYSAVDDFAPIALIAEIPLVLITRKDLPVTSLKDFVAYAKANGPKMNYGSAGAGSSTHLGCALLTHAIGVNIQHVPYRGTGPAMQDLNAGRIDFLCEIIVTAVPQVESGNVKGIATLAAQRSSVLPAVPTAAEQGFPALQAYSFTALFAPKGTPPAAVKLLHDAALKTMDTPAVQERLAKLGATIVAPQRRSSDYLGTYVKDELAKWKVIVQASGLQLQ